jgi:DNA invertase Pin-like site-specific DNA recombinase
LKQNELPVIGAAYVRVSTNDQTELSPDAQVREIKKAAKADGILIPKEFIFIEEKGISGRRADNRKQFQKMISIAKSQPSPFQYLYLWKFSRFARNQEESTFYKSVLRKKCGVTIKSVSEPIMDGMFGRLIESIIEWFDEYYSFNLSGEVIRGMTEKALREGYQTTPCLGYDAAGGGKPFLINEKEYKIVEFIHKSYHDGMDLSAIARDANQRGFLTKRGNPFDRRSIERILKNKFYDGIVTWKDISFCGSHEVKSSITSIFKENQIRLQQEYRPKSRREVSDCKHWASGLLRCGYCGASLGYNKTAKTGSGTSYFQCWRYSKGYHRESCSIIATKAEALILESLKKVLINADNQNEYVRIPSSNKTDEEEILKAALIRNSAKMLRIRDAYENGIDTLEEYKNHKERLEKNKTELELKLKGLKNKHAEEEKTIKTQLSPRLQNAYVLLSDPGADNETKGKALRSVVKKIVYDKEKNKLKFFYYISS